MGYHSPVLLQECLGGLAIKADGSYVDVTFGGGGHSKALLQKLSAKGRLLAFDQDADALANKVEDERLVLVNQNFSYLKNFALYNGFNQVDGLLADLGVSSHQFDVAERGFSIRFDGVLDMRMNASAGLSAKDILLTYEEKELRRVFSEYGELYNAGKVAYIICRERASKKIETTFQLLDVLKGLVNKKKEHQFFAQVFQALRIEVNGELDVLKSMLQQALELLKPGGRLVVMSYHSLEDRLVKNFMRSGNFEGTIEKNIYGVQADTPFKLITKKPIEPSEEELVENNRSRSAKLRIAEKI